MSGILNIVELASTPFPELNALLTVGLGLDDDGDPQALVLSTQHATPAGGLEPDEPPLVLRRTAIPSLRALIDAAREPWSRCADGPDVTVLAQHKDLALGGTRSKGRAMLILGSTDKTRMAWWPGDLDVLTDLLDAAERELAQVGHMVEGSISVN